MLFRSLETLMAARRLGVEKIFEEQMRETRADVHDWMIKVMPVMPPKAYRWVPEMLQIAETLEGLKDAQGQSVVSGIFAAVPYCIDLIGGPYLETRDEVCKAFRPKTAIRPPRTA